MGRYSAGIVCAHRDGFKRHDLFASEPRMLEVYPEGASASGSPEHGEGSETADCASIRLAPAPILLDRAQSRGLQE